MNRRVAYLFVLAATLSWCAPDSAAQPPVIPTPDLRVEAATDAPARVARFIGAWGPGAWDGLVPHVLVVESVDATGAARVVYGLGDYPAGNVDRGSRRIAGRVDGDILTVPLGAGASATYEVAGESLRGTYTSGRRVSTVLLHRATLAQVTAAPATQRGVVTAITVRLPTRETGAGGAGVTLEATLYRPPGDGPHPVLLFNHGSTGGGTVAATTTLRPDRQAPFFVERGFAVLAPMRRGRGASEGVHGEAENSCDPGVLNPGLARAIEDVDAMMAYVRVQPWADPDRIVIAGQSRGGLLSVVYAGERPGTVRAVVSFAGGWTSERCDGVAGGFNETAFTAAARRIRVPMIWLYAEGDRYYSASAIRRYHDRFTRAGGTATFHLFPAFAGDGHRLIDRPELWSSALDEFLRASSLSPK
jgi:dienelactone hydrolase